MEDNIILSLFYFLLGGLFLIFGYVLFKNKVSRNVFFGIRLKKSLESDELWYRINRYGGKCSMLWSIPYIILGGLYIILPELLEYEFLILLGLLMLTVPIIQIYQFSRKL